MKIHLYNKKNLIFLWGVLLFISTVLLIVNAITFPTPDANTVIYFHFDKNISIGENAIHIVDSTDYQENATSYGDFVYTSNGYSEGAYYSNGSTTNNITSSGTFSFNTTKDYTWMGWAKIDNVGEDNVLISYGEANVGGIAIYESSGGDIAVSSLKSPYPGFTSSADKFQDGVWKHFAVTYNSTNKNFTIYTSGVNLVSENISVDNSTGFNLVFGWNSLITATNSLNGTIDEFLFYNRTLSDSEILNIYRDYVDQVTDCFELEAPDTTYTLVNDVSSTGTCFKVLENNITLDCAGYNLTYNTAGSSEVYGIEIGTVTKGYENFTLKDCEVYLGNKTNTGSNPDGAYGIYLREGSHNFNILNSTIVTATRENWGMFIEGSNDGNITNSTIEFSYGTSGWSNPTPVWVDSSTGITFWNSRLNLTDGKSFSINATISLGSNGDEATLVNTTYIGSQTAEYLPLATQKLYRKWYVDAQVNNTEGTPIANTNVSAYNSTGSYQGSALTGGNGKTSGLALVEYVNIGGTKNYSYNNHTLNATALGYNVGSKTVNVTGNVDADITMYSDIVVTLVSPTNDTTIPEDYDFNCSVSTSLFDLNNITIYIWNSTGDLINQTSQDLTGLENSTIFSQVFTYDDTYTWNCEAYNNISNSESSTSNNTFYTSITNPAVNLNSPTNNLWFQNGTNIYFNFTATDSDGLDTCDLYGNWSGGWHKNYTWTNPSSGVMNYTILNLTDGFYKYNVLCNDSLSNSGFANSNKTFGIDTIDPIVTINSVKTTTNSQTIYFNVTINDLNLDSCKYTIFNSSGQIDGINENVSINCNSNSHPATVTSYNSYTLRVYASDLSERETYDEEEFTTSQSQPSSGDGGGGNPLNKITVIAIIKPLNFTELINNLNRAKIYARIRDGCGNFSKIDSCKLKLEEKNIIIENLKDQSVDLTLNEFDLFFNNYLSDEIEEVSVSEADADNYNLFKAKIEVLENPLSLSPFRLDPICLTFGKLKMCSTLVTSNKILSSVEVVSGELGLSVEQQSDTTTIVSYELQSTDFTAKTIKGKINYVSVDGESEFQDVNIRIFNLASSSFLIGSGVIGLLGFIIYINRKKLKIFNEKGKFIGT